MARILPNGSLLLPAIGIVDEGTFRCRAINKRGKEIKSHYRVRVYGKGSEALAKSLFIEEKAFFYPLDSWPWYTLISTARFPCLECENPQKAAADWTFPVEIPGKPEIVDPAPELTAGVPSKVQENKTGRVL